MGESTRDLAVRAELRTRPGGGLFPARAVRVRQTVAQSLTNATWTQIAMTTEDEDAGSEWASSQYTCQRGGVYLVTGVVAFAANVTNSRWVRLENNAVPIDGCAKNSPPLAGGNLTSLDFSWSVRLAANDALRVMGFQDSGGLLDTFAGAPYMSSLQIVLVAT